MFIVVDRGRAVKAKINTVQLFTVNGLYDHLVDLHLAKDPEWSRERDPTLAHLRVTLDEWYRGNTTSYRRDGKLIYTIIPDDQNTRIEVRPERIIHLIREAETLENTNV